jgi:large subunit ribosomal protein L29
MASILRAHELDEMNETDLEARLREAKEELFNLRFQAATGQLESHGRLRTVKKDIARIYTVVRERELGIRTTPSATDEKADPADKVKAGKSKKVEKATKEGADA